MRGSSSWQRQATQPNRVLAWQGGKRQSQSHSAKLEGAVGTITLIWLVLTVTRMKHETIR